MLQHAVHKPTGTGADVKAGASGEINVPMREGALQFKTSARDVTEVLSEDTYRGIRVH
jgi:hypothetical protein